MNIICSKCAIISRGIVGHCSHVLALLAAEREWCAKIADSLRDKTYWDDPVAGIAAKIREGHGV